MGETSEKVEAGNTKEIEFMAAKHAKLLAAMPMFAE